MTGRGHVVTEMMSATRLLVLGVVRLLGRAHGYLVASELESWMPPAY